MAQNFISPSYTFTPGAAGVGTLNLSGITGFSIKRLIAVVNVTRGVVIYSPVNPATNVASTTLTLGVDTSTHNAADNLIVKYESSQSDNLQISGADASSSNPVPITTRAKYVDVTLSLDTSAYADGDVLADTQEVTGALTANDGTGVIQSIQVLDENDQGVAMDLIFLDANVSLGTENSAPSITDANSRNILGRVQILAADYIDLGGAKMATVTGVGLGIKAGSGVDDIWVAAITRGGTPTYTASGVRLRIYIVGD